MVTIRFSTVGAYRTGVTTFCTNCQKKLKRSLKEEQTHNPWNTVEENGVKRPRTREEIWADCNAKLKARIADLTANGTVCQKCGG
jgi:bacterioferritin-associated ferredoxin